jgi:hypothetical protein
VVVVWAMELGLIRSMDHKQLQLTEVILKIQEKKSEKNKCLTILKSEVIENQILKSEESILQKESMNKIPTTFQHWKKRKKKKKKKKDLRNNNNLNKKVSY